MNALQQGFSGLIPFARCIAFSGLSGVTPTATWTPIDFNTDIINESAIHNIGLDPKRFNQIAGATHVQATARVVWDSRPSCNNLGLALYHSNDGFLEQAIADRTNTTGAITHDAGMFLVTPIIEVGSSAGAPAYSIQIYQNSGGNLTLSSLLPNYVAITFYKKY